MSASQQRREKKHEQILKLYEKVSTCKQILLVTLANVGSKQVQMIRRDLGKNQSDLVIGKNTIMKKVLKMRANPLDKKDPDYEFFAKFGEPLPQLNTLYNLLTGKLGFIFSDKAVFELLPIIESNRVATVAKVGVVAPCNVVVPPGPTGMDPSQIGFFHALKITTKINKGQIEILKEVNVCEAGKVVGNSEAAFLKKLNMTPFMYGMDLHSVYDDGAILSADIAKIKPENLLKSFSEGVSNIVALSLELNIPTAPAVPHMLSNAFKNLCAVSLESGYKLDALEKAKAAAATATTSAPVQSSSKVEAKVEEKAPVEEEADMDMGDLFG